MLVLIVRPGRPLRPGRREARVKPLRRRLHRLARRRARGRAAPRRLPAEGARHDYFNYRLAFVGIYFIAIVGLNVLTGYNGPDLARARRLHGDRRLHDGDPERQPRVGLYWTIPIAGHPHRPVRLRVRLPGAPAQRASTWRSRPSASRSPSRSSRSGSRGSPAAARGRRSLPSSPIGGLTSNEWISY